jgi:hypothetical protein
MLAGYIQDFVESQIDENDNIVLKKSLGMKVAIYIRNSIQIKVVIFKLRI